MTICEHCIRGHVEHFGSNHLLCSFEGLRMQGLEYLGGIGGLNVGKIILPLSKALNPNCSSEASLWSWSADQTVVILITCGNVYNRVNFIRVFLQKRALPSMKLTWISLLKKVITIHTFLFHFFFSGPSTLPEEELGYLWKPHRYATAGTFVSCHSRSVHPKNFFMKKHKEIQYPVCTAVFDLNLLLQYVALTAWGHLHPTYICANKCPFAFGFPYDLSLLPHSASRPPQIGWWWIGKKKKKNYSFAVSQRGEGWQRREADTEGLNEQAQRQQLPITGPSAVSYQHSF